MQSTHSTQRAARRVVRPLMIAIVAVVAAGLLLGVAACGGDEASIVGVWQDSTGFEFEFTADGDFVSEETEGLGMTYEIQGDEITFNSDFGAGVTIGFSLDGDTLKIEDYETGEYETATRVK